VYCIIIKPVYYIYAFTILFLPSHCDGRLEKPTDDETSGPVVGVAATRSARVIFCASVAIGPYPQPLSTKLYALLPPDGRMDTTIAASGMINFIPGRRVVPAEMSLATV
jgi:hypothetical protein